MTSSKPPVLRVIIAKETPEKVLTKVVLHPEIKDWVRLGWTYVCSDPGDQEKIAKWIEKTNLFKQRET